MRRHEHPQTNTLRLANILINLLRPEHSNTEWRQVFCLQALLWRNQSLKIESLLKIVLDPGSYCPNKHDRITPNFYSRQGHLKLKVSSYFCFRHIAVHTTKKRKIWHLEYAETMPCFLNLIHVYKEEGTKIMRYF